MPIAPAEHLTTQALTLALDAAAVRHRVIAANLAHTGSPGYAAQRVSFEALVQASASGRPDRLELRPHVEAAEPAPGGVTPTLDESMSALAQNTLHTQVLLRAVQRHLGLLALAAADGKR